jgi:hypothetical protein
VLTEQKPFHALLAISYLKTTVLLVQQLIQPGLTVLTKIHLKVVLLDIILMVLFVQSALMLRHLGLIAMMLQQLLSVLQAFISMMETV